VCAIGYFLERAGIMTTGISLVRENAENLQPPRSLWVTFPFGRPLGLPNDAAFQHRVIAAALALLERERGPVLEDFPEDASVVNVESAPACPVSFGKVNAGATGDATWQARLTAEASTLAPWYELGRRRRGGRTLVGVSGSSIVENLSRLGEYLDAEQLPTDDLHWFKRAIEDAKSYYIEALTAQPGDYNHNKTYEMLWHETQLGAGLTKFYEGFRSHPKLHPFARIVLPRDALAGRIDRNARP